mmetsp:Transcript_17712/g.58302  ORF Transcript_17712/g.58302 Transcript_17712/m.58302 type:complete len:203 (+) Transcript_17712:205-813(+)
MEKTVGSLRHLLNALQPCVHSLKDLTLLGLYPSIREAGCHEDLPIMLLVLDHPKRLPFPSRHRKRIWFLIDERRTRRCVYGEGRKDEVVRIRAVTIIGLDLYTGAGCGPRLGVSPELSTSMQSLFRSEQHPFHVTAVDTEFLETLSQHTVGQNVVVCVLHACGKEITFCSVDKRVKLVLLLTTIAIQHHHHRLVRAGHFLDS